MPLGWKTPARLPSPPLQGWSCDLGPGCRPPELIHGMGKWGEVTSVLGREARERRGRRWAPAGMGSACWACGFLCVSESVCVCLNLSVCVCALTPPPQRSRDASSGGGCPVCLFPLPLSTLSQWPLLWAPLRCPVRDRGETLRTWGWSSGGAPLVPSPLDPWQDPGPQTRDGLDGRFLCPRPPLLSTVLCATGP